MRKTAKLKLGGHTWQVERHDMRVERLWGETIHFEKRIRLEKTMSGPQLDETLIHECIHAVNNTMGHDLTEETVRQLAVGLQQMLAPYLRVKGV